MAAFQYQCRMLGVVLWKSWRVRKHRKWQTLIEIAAPVLLVILLVSVKIVMDSSNEDSEAQKPKIFRTHNIKSLITNLCNIGCTNKEKTAIVAFAPNSPIAKDLMKDVEITLKKNEANAEVHGFETELEVEALAALLRVNSSAHFGKPSVLIAAVTFLATPSYTTNFMYSIRLMTPKFITGKTFSDSNPPGPGKQYEVYETTGFLGLQLATDLAFLKRFSLCSLPFPPLNVTCPRPQVNISDIETQALPYPPYKRVNKFHYNTVLATLLPAAIIFGFTEMLSISIKVVTEERTTGVKLFLTMLGLKNLGYWLGWFLDLFAVALISVALIVLVLTSELFGDGAVLMASSASVIWIFLLLYIIAVIWFCFFIASIMHTAKHARLLGAAILIGTFVFPALLVGTKQRYLATQFMIALLPNMCLYWGSNIIASWEFIAIGVQWSNLEQHASRTDSLNLASMIAMLVFDGVLYFLLTIFLQNSHMKSLKLKRPFQLFYDVLYDDTKFPEFVRCLKLGGCIWKKKKTVILPPRSGGQDSPSYSSMGALRTKVLEKLELLNTPKEEIIITTKTGQKDCGIKIIDLKKSFNSVAVLKGFSCDFYRNEISCIVGDSGCGKTVLLQILLGVLKADEGVAYVNGYDIQDYMTDVRRSIGFSPQQNMLFPDLTVLEHLLMFGWLKGKDWNSVYQQAKRVANLLKLKDQEKVSAKKLSKPSQRLLSCSIAVMGDPKIMIFDDPTFEMDAKSAECFWTIVNKHREGRTIVFTSQSINDAVSIADRIAVVNDGKLRCVDSPQYLNTVFGDGYMIRLRVTASSAERLVRIICQELDDSEVKTRNLSVSGEDVAFKVAEAYVSLFPKLFYQLFDFKDEFGLISVQIDSLSIDDVFNSVHERNEFKKQPKVSKAEGMTGKNVDTNKTSTSSFFEGKKLVGCCLSLSRLRALLIKNYQLSRSGCVIFIFQVIVPLVFILAGITGANRALRNKDVHHYGQVNIGLETYKNPLTLYSINDTAFKSAYQAVVEGSNSKEVEHVSDYAIDFGETETSNYRLRLIAASQEISSLQVKAMYSTMPLHAPPLAVNLVSNALLRRIESSSKIKIVVENHPMLNSSDFEDNVSTSVTSDSTSTLIKSICFYFAYAIAIICAMVAVKQMLEKASGSHNIQMMTGVNPCLFWTSCLIVDGLYVLFFAGVSLLIVYFAQERYLFTINGGGLILFLILYIGGLYSICFAYFFSQLVNDSALGFGWLNILHLLAALGSYLMYNTNDGINGVLSELYFWVTTPLPIPFIVHSLFIYGKVVVENSRCEFISNHLKSAVCSKTGLYVYLPAYTCCDNCKTNCFVPKDYFQAYYGFPMYTLILDLSIQGFFAIFYLILVILMDFNCFQRLSRYFLSAPSEAFNSDKSDKDPSAAQEVEMVRKLIGLGGQISEKEGLLVDSLSKNIGTVAVYSHISFSVQKGECFGLLGLNGAGKSWVFRTLTGEILPSVGDAFISPYSMLASGRQFSANIGYCPQNNCVFSALTALETLKLYGSLKGICKKDLMTEVQQWLSSLGLVNDANRRCEQLSLGMQRRLCLAIALIGNPKVIILDEPSRDIDPSMKKHIWNTLQRLQKDGKVIILASQNVHECEHMCGKVGLMINGRLQYVGTTKEIKSKFLNGYTVAFKLTKRFSVDDASDLETVAEIKASIELILDDAVFRDVFQNTLKYLIPIKNQNWGRIVEKLEKIRTQLSSSVAYYSLTESTLEEVFNAMTELDEEPTNELPGTKVSFYQRCFMGQCCADDYS